MGGTSKPTGALTTDQRPLKLIRWLSGIMLILGIVIFVVGVGVASGNITRGWGRPEIPLSPVPNWGQPWGLVLIVAASAYVLCPLYFLTHPQSGWKAMMILGGLNVLIGTPIIQTSTEILYYYGSYRQLIVPELDDSMWFIFIVINIAIALAACHQSVSGDPVSQAKTNG